MKTFFTQTLAKSSFWKDRRTVGWHLAFALCVVVPASGRGEPVDRYVAPQAPASAWPYTTWSTAATNIQDAVDAANASNAGDHVIISNGTYLLTEAIVVSNAVVRSFTGDRETVVVDGNYPAVNTRCFILRHEHAVLSGLTIVRGSARTNEFPELQGSGGGVWADGGLVRDCRVADCRAEVKDTHCGGGGIYAWNTTVDSCEIVDNQVSSMTGALSGLYITGGGGGILLRGYTGDFMTNCLVARNKGYNVKGAVSGGGVCIAQDSSACIRNCTIVSNSTAVSGYGGGIYVRPRNGCEITGCTVSWNTGGGIWMYGTYAPLIRNCIIANNTANNVAGEGLYYFYSTKPWVLESSTITANPAGGIRYYSNCTGATNNVSNCIVYDNGAGTDLRDDTAAGLLKESLWYSCVPPGTGFFVAHAVTAPPLFVDGAKGDYRLSVASPCINKGIYQTWMTGAPDGFGDRRLRGGRVDIGAHEYVSVGSVIMCR